MEFKRYEVKEGRHMYSMLPFTFVKTSEIEYIIKFPQSQIHPPYNDPEKDGDWNKRKK